MKSVNQQLPVSGVADLDAAWTFTPGYRIAGQAVAGAGYAWANHNLLIDFDTRYRFFSRCVGNHRRGPDTAQTTVGIGWRL